MRISLDTLTKYPAIWLGVYALGSVMVVATISHVAGGTAAGSSAGMFALAGTFGYDFLTRRNAVSLFTRRVRILEDAQQKLSAEVLAAHDELEMIKEDLERTKPRMVPPTKARTNTSAFMPRQRPANAPIMEEHLAETSDKIDELIAPQKSLSPRAQKYKDILKNWAHLKPASQKFAMSNDAEKFGMAGAASPLEYSDAVVSELLHRALDHDRIEIFAQPIVRLPSRKLAYVELFARIRAKAGVYLSGDSYRKVAEKESVIEHIDLLILRHAIHTVTHDSHGGANVGYFINIAASTLSNRAYVSELVEFVKANRDLADRFIFELRYNDFMALLPIPARVLKGLCTLGCRASIDNMVMRGTFDPSDLVGHNISFVKCNSQELVDMCQSNGGAMDVARLKYAFDQCGITLIVEKFEEEHNVLELLDFEIDYGAGYLFGKPDLEIAYRNKQRA